MMRRRIFSWFLTVVMLAVLFVPSADAAGELRYGSRGEKVRQMQQKLKNWGYYSGAVDGVYGDETLAAVKLFQKRNGLTQDGVVGSRTAAMMGLDLGSLPSGSTGASGHSDHDVYLLATAIHAEARGEPYLGQVAVGAVILNRVDSARFPNTVSGVVYQAGAFTAVSDGQIRLAPDDEAIRAARDAMNGWDPSGGALYYYNPAKTTSDWIYSRRVITVIGRHYFAV